MSWLSELLNGTSSSSGITKEMIAPVDIPITERIPTYGGRYQATTLEPFKAGAQQQLADQMAFGGFGSSAANMDWLGRNFRPAGTYVYGPLPTTLGPYATPGSPTGTPTPTATPTPTPTPTTGVAPGSPSGAPLTSGIARGTPTTFMTPEAIANARPGQVTAWYTDSLNPARRPSGEIFRKPGDPRYPVVNMANLSGGTDTSHGRGITEAATIVQPVSRLKTKKYVQR